METLAHPSRFPSLCYSECGTEQGSYRGMIEQKESLTTACFTKKDGADSI